MSWKCDLLSAKHCLMSSLLKDPKLKTRCLIWVFQSQTLQAVSCDGTRSVSTFRPQRPKGTAVRLFNLLHKSGHSHDKWGHKHQITDISVSQHKPKCLHLHQTTSNSNTNTANINVFFYLKAQNTRCVFLSELLNKSPKGSGRVMSLLVSRWAWGLGVSMSEMRFLCFVAWQVCSLQSVHERVMGKVRLVA